MKKTNFFPVIQIILLAFSFIMISCTSNAAFNGEISFHGTTWTWKNSDGWYREIRFYDTTYEYYVLRDSEPFQKGNYWVDGDKLWISSAWVREGELAPDEYFAIKKNTIRDISHNPARVFKLKK